MGGKSNKARLNLTIDPAVYRQARRAFDLMEMNMSGFVEMQLALFLQGIKPFEPLMEDIRAGKADPAAMKVAMRAFSAHANSMVGQQLVQFGQIQTDIAGLTQEVPTDKK